MQRHHTARNVLLAVAALSAVAATPPAMALTMQTEGPPANDPVGTLGEMSAPRNEFFLNSDRDAEVIRFSQAGNNQVCVPQQRADMVDTPKHGLAVKAMWNDRQAIVQPGHCLTIDAKVLKLQPAEPLPDDTVLLGEAEVSGR